MLLTNNIGSNLRNAVAHGLLDDDTASGGCCLSLVENIKMGNAICRDWS